MHKINYSWLYGCVKPYFEVKGIKLLKDDMLFIERCLANIPPDRHRLVLRGYYAIWNTTIAEKENQPSMTVNPRFEANTYLRNTCGINNT